MLFNVQYVMGGGWDLYTQSVNAFAGDRLTGEWKVTLLTLGVHPTKNYTFKFCFWAGGWERDGPLA